MFIFAFQLIHPDMKYDPNSNPPSYASEDQVGTPPIVLLRVLKLF